MENTISPDQAFDPELRPQINQKVRAIVKEALAETDAHKAGVLRTGGKRSKKAPFCAVGVMFREPSNTEAKGIPRNLSIGRRELVWEFRPSIVNSTGIKLRAVAGEHLPADLLDESANIFTRLREEGAFDQDYGAGLTAMLKDFVKNRTSTILQPTN